MNISVLDNYDFLKVLGQEHNEEIEVTYEAIDCYSNNFSMYNSKNGWKKYQYASHRNQMSTSGCWLHNINRNTIDIAGDILTSIKAFSGMEDINPELNQLFKRLYHTIGNCIPWPEGGNLGGRPFKKGGSPDNYYRKLIACKEIMDKKVKYETECVKCKIANSKTLGGSCYSSIQYWIDEIWNDYNWEDFVERNFLQDMVDKDLVPIPFVVGGENIDVSNKSQKNIQIIKDTYEQSIMMIICRGYRIKNNGDLDVAKMNKIFEEVGLKIRKIEGT